MTRESGCLFGVDTSVRDGISNNYLQTRLPSPSRSHVCFSTNVGRETATDSVNVVTRVPSTYNRVIIVPKCLDKSNEQRETLAFFFFSFLFFSFFLKYLEKVGKMNFLIIEDRLAGKLTIFQFTFDSLEMNFAHSIKHAAFLFIFRIKISKSRITSFFHSYFFLRSNFS